MAHRYRTRVVSDVIRDGIGVELLSDSGDVVAEVFRSDGDHTVVLNTFSYDVPLEAIGLLLTSANERLEPFEDGQPLSDAVLAAPQLIRSPEQ